MNYTKEEITKASREFVSKIDKALFDNKDELGELLKYFVNHSVSYKTVDKRPVGMTVILEFKPADIETLVKVKCLEKK
ncbi:hypothetical protein [Cetobacterium sp.]|uniref:hypothetical protein n=1 Tax=Cetobacterium sp. TaxID=2071632 RepID=UPI003F34B144